MVLVPFQDGNRELVQGLRPHDLEHLHLEIHTRRRGRREWLKNNLDGGIVARRIFHTTVGRQGPHDIRIGRSCGGHGKTGNKPNED
jgi:hypothetical protein